MKISDINNTPAIVVLPSGFIYVGRVTIDRNDESLAITECRNIRKWGTSKGLGQLVIEGPQSDTVLDDVGFLLVHYPSQVHQILPLTEDAAAGFSL